MLILLHAGNVRVKAIERGKKKKIFHLTKKKFIFIFIHLKNTDLIMCGYNHIMT